MAVRHHSMELSRSSIANLPDFTPGYIKSSPSGGRRMQRGGPSGSASSMKKGEPGVAGRKVIQVSLQQDVKLHTAENAWKPVVGKKDALSPDDDDAATQVMNTTVIAIYLLLILVSNRDELFCKFMNCCHCKVGSKHKDVSLKSFSASHALHLCSLCTSCDLL